MDELLVDLMARGSSAPVAELARLVALVARCGRNHETAVLMINDKLLRVLLTALMKNQITSRLRL